METYPYSFSPTLFPQVSRVRPLSGQGIVDQEENGDHHSLAPSEHPNQTLECQGTCLEPARWGVETHAAGVGPAPHGCPLYGPLSDWRTNLTLASFPQDNDPFAQKTPSHSKEVTDTARLLILHPPLGLLWSEPRFVDLCYWESSPHSLSPACKGALCPFDSWTARRFVFTSCHPNSQRKVQNRERKREERKQQQQRTRLHSWKHAN